MERNIRRMAGREKGGSTTQVQIKDEDGTVVELTNKEDINKTIAKGNEKIRHQTEGGSQLINQEFIRKLDNHGEGH